MRILKKIQIFFSKHKWRFYWVVFVVLVLLFIYLAFFFEDKKWLGNALQTIGSIAGVYATLLVFLHTKEGSDKQFREHLDYQQTLNNKQIEALQNATEIQITKLQELTEKQIIAIAENTNKQIQTYSSETKKIVDELTDNSVLLGEILKRELEKALMNTDQQIQLATTQLESVKGFVIGRTEIEKEQQIKYHSASLQWLNSWRERLYKKYQNLMDEFKE
jgi:ABC-type multidrug transport system fused ATPase/permease subunit